MEAKPFITMAIFMDRHDIPGATAKDVAEAHQEDLKIQDEYDCRGLTYWFDEEKGMAFCLIEAPDKKSVQELHDHAHGLIPNQIIEVEPKIVEAFLGRIEDPVDQNQTDTMIINDPAFRAIMVIDLNKVVLITAKVGADNAYHILNDSQETIRSKVKKYQGLQVEHTDECFMASFASATDAVVCALAIQKCFRECNYSPGRHSATDYQIYPRIGLSAGVPVSGDNTFFGPTVKLAKRLSFITRAGQTTLASTVHELCKTQNSNIHAEENCMSALTPADEEFLEHVMDTIETKGCEAEFNVEVLCNQIGVSKSQLYRKMISITGYSPNDFIKEYRLKKAIEFIEKQKGNISEVAYESGFSSLSYFSKCFQKRFDILPSDYANTIA